MRPFCRSVVATGAMVTSAWTCDLCTTYSAAQAHGEMGPGPFAGVAEQFTHFGTVQEDGQVIPNPDDQYLNSSISQLFAGYDFTKHLEAQVNLPVIYRSLRRPEGAGGIDSGTVAGIGDVTLMGNGVVSGNTNNGQDAALRAPGA